MNSLFCFKTGFTSNDRNNVRKTFILNAHTLYFYLQKMYSRHCLNAVTATTELSRFLLLKRLLSKQGPVRVALPASPRRYFLCLPFW